MVMSACRARSTGDAVTRSVRKRLGVWTKGKAVAQMKEALGGAFALALAQHREAQQRGAAGAAALERLAAAAQATRDG